MHDTIIMGRRSRISFKWLQNESEFELFLPIASNKNGQKIIKNFKVMTRAIRAQSPREDVDMITLKEMKSTLPEKKGREFYQHTKKPWGHSKFFWPRSLPKASHKRPNQKSHMDAKSSKRRKKCNK